ncbi:MAG: hypothetical protein ACXWLE_08805 [Rhizomicrobium sp.]
MRVKTLALAAALAATSLAVTSASASDKSDVMATVNRYNDDVNKNDSKSANALCTDQVIIIDDFAPHAWQGATACSDWWNALDADNKKNGITDGIVTIGKPWHVTITGDRGYAVFPTHYTYKLKGKPVTEQGVWTFAMQKLAASWRIAGWAWAQH